MLEGSSKAAQADQRKKQKSNLLTAGLLVVVIILILGLLPSNNTETLPLLPTLSSQQEPASPLNPSFLIVGAYKAGTTSLLRYLETHPRVCVSNEANHFNVYGKFVKGLASYRDENFGHCAGQDGVLIGEKSSRYLFHSQTPARIRKELPQAKIIILLRNPVERLYSQWHAQNCRYKLSQEFSNFLEEDPLAKGLGFYDEAVARWLHYFNRDQILILRSEDLFESPKQILAQVTDFLGLPKHQFSDKQLANHYGEFCGRFDKPSMDSTTRRMLENIYQPSKQKLEALLEKPFGWF